jgi:Flp pilus assembly pilin Flp
MLEYALLLVFLCIAIIGLVGTLGAITSEMFNLGNNL